MAGVNSNLSSLTERYAIAAEKIDAIGSRVRLGTEEEFPEIVAMDLERLRRRVNFNAGSNYPLEAILFRTIEGHMKMGDGLFYGRIYPNKRLSDIVYAAGMNEQEVMDQGQEFIHRLEKYVGNVLELALGKHKKPRRGITSLKIKSTPVLDLPFLDGSVEPLHVLKGIVCNGFVDSHEIRSLTMQHPKYGKTILGRDLVIGSGEQLFVDEEKYGHQFGDLRYLSVVEHSDEMIDVLTELNLVAREPKKGMAPHYTRRKLGWGTSDDLSIIMAGETYRNEGALASTSAMKGFFLGDAADTMDTFLSYPVIGGWDEMLARYIQQVWKDETLSLLVPTDTLMRITCYAAKDNDPMVHSSSSHRWLSQVRGTSKEARSMFESHINFVNGGRRMDDRVGYNGPKGRDFYNAANQRRLALRQELNVA